MEGDTYTPAQAARILKLTPHRIRQMLHSGELEGEQDPESARWRIPQRAVHELLEERPRGRGRGSAPPPTSPEEPALGEIGGRFFELSEELKRLHREMGRMEGRLELTEVTESTLRESLERERQRADQERERAERLESEARQLRERADACRRRNLRGADAQAATEISVAARSLIDWVLHGEAQAYLERALEIRESALGERNFDASAILFKLGILHQLGGRDEQARKHLQQALPVRAEICGKTHPATELVRENLRLLDG